MFQCSWERSKVLCNNFECFWSGEKVRVTDDDQNILLWWNFDAKFDGSHHSRIFEGEKGMKDLETNYYIGVVELETTETRFVISETKKLDVVAVDVALAYIQVMSG